MRKSLRKLLGHIRLFFGLCPECNSDAPEIDCCPVCDGYRSSERGVEFPPTAERKEVWWRRFNQARCLHGIPLECRCALCNAWLKNHLDSEKGNPRRG